MLKEVEANSDDEGPIPNAADPSGWTYYINHKRGHNPYITDFICELDTPHFKTAEALGHSQYVMAKRSHQFDANRATYSDIGRCFPRDTTLDWFDPEYFNILPVSMRALYRDSGIAIPLPDDWKTNWKTLSYEDFMDQFGDKVLCMYNLPTDSDLECGDNDNDDMDED
ncbi:hypothetical protein K438DRAFT_1983031 [Mycena galopus ATCC 62051]|nr:hypothetical protein K438DRAFT_1983031 [Mycena galopus ATCC 62051]